MCRGSVAGEQDPVKEMKLHCSLKVNKEEERGKK